MIINKQLLSIPPFISTSWKDIELLLSDGQNTLNIYLKNGTLVKISHLLKEHLNLIFSVHQEILLNQAQEVTTPIIDPLFFQFSGPFLEHDPDLCDASPLPDEVRSKLKSLIENLPKMDPSKMPVVHDNCFCPHCQLINLIFENTEKEELVSDSDLTFSTWIQEEVSDDEIKLIHPYNSDEFYIIKLQNPLQCSCQMPDCEHLLHVLRN
jgi:hypothetical protein